MFFAGLFIGMMSLLEKQEKEGSDFSLDNIQQIMDQFSKEVDL